MEVLQEINPRIPQRVGYWFRASGDNFYIVELESRFIDDYGLVNVTATVYQPDLNLIDDDVKVIDLKKGQEVKYNYLFDDDEDWIMNISISSKYYLTNFNEEHNQWSHGYDDHESCDMDDFIFILKEAYNKAIEVSGIKIYR